MTYLQRSLIYWPTAIIGGAYLFDAIDQAMPYPMAFSILVLFATFYAVLMGIGRP